MTTAMRDIDVVLRIEPWWDDSRVNIRITEGYREQMQDLLTEAQISNSQAVEFSAASTALELISAAIEIPEFWEALGAVVVAFLKRHENKRIRVKIGDQTFEMDGGSASEGKRLARLIAELQHRAAPPEIDQDPEG